MISYRDFDRAFQNLNINRSNPVIAHASLSAFGKVKGGAGTVVGALTSTFDTVVMPAFTYQSILTPLVGPSGNAIQYGSGNERNREAQFFHRDLEVHASIGRISETLRCHQQSERSDHPILSFTGVNANPYLSAQTLSEPLAPIGLLTKQQGWVLLLGVDQRANTSIHYAERLAGRKQFVRWALTPAGVIECRHFPGCSEGFNQLDIHLQAVVRTNRIGESLIQAFPLHIQTSLVHEWIMRDQNALLCNRDECQRCAAIRNSP